MTKKKTILQGMVKAFSNDYNSYITSTYYLGAFLPKLSPARSLAAGRLFEGKFTPRTEDKVSRRDGKSYFDTWRFVPTTHRISGRLLIVFYKKISSTKI